MKSKIKAFVKKSKLVYTLYFLVGSLALRILGLFLRTDPELVLFISYGGKKYDDSPRVLYEYLKKHPTSPGRKYVWAFLDPEQFPQVENRVKVDTLAYFVTALRAGTWITNSSASRGMSFKKKRTRYYMFTHGMTGIKKIGADIHSSKKAFSLAVEEDFDAIFVEGKKEIPILVQALERPAEIFRATGLPRNDDLAEYSAEEALSIRERLGIPAEKKVILYAPTFREFSRERSGLNTLGIPFDFSKWERALGDEYVLLITAHYEVAKLLDTLPDNGFVFNAFQYPVLNDLLKVADLLISDYSSIVFDYAILERPIFCYAYDYDSYSVERGLYTDLNRLFSHGVLRTEDEVLDVISAMDYESECRFTKERIKDVYMAAYGNAAEKAAAIIFGEDGLV